MFLTSSKLLINKETAFIKEDLDRLPYPEDETYLELTKIEGIIQDDVLKYYIHFGKAISANSAGNILLQQVKPEQLKHFGEVFCDVLNAIYSKDDKSWQPGIIQQTGSYTVYQFGFGKNDGLRSGYNESHSEEIETLIEDKISANHNK